MRCLLLGLLAVCVLANPMTAGKARADEAGQYTSLAGLGRLFATETPVWVVFADDETRLDAEALARLDQQAAWIASFKGLRVRVYGISAQTGYPPRNMAMAMKRANAVVRYLVSKGVDPAQLEAVVLLGNAPRPNFAESGASTVTEIVGLPVQDAGAVPATS